jgi:hypothetical protein
VDLSDYDVILVPRGTHREPSGRAGWSPSGAGSGGEGRWWPRERRPSAWRSPWPTWRSGPASEERTKPDRDARLARALRTREERAEERGPSGCPGPSLRSLWTRPTPGLRGGGRGRRARTGSSSSPPGWGSSRRTAETVAWFPEGLDRISGVISERNLERLDRSAWLVERRQGSGKVILFADDPVFRGSGTGPSPLRERHPPGSPLLTPGGSPVPGPVGGTVSRFPRSLPPIRRTPMASGAFR